MDIFIFDLDGTVYKGNKLIDKADKIIKLLQRKGKKVYFITNNSSYSRKHYCRKLNDFGIKVKIENIITSTIITVLYLKNNKGYRVFPVGTKEFVKELEKEDIKITDENPDFVVVGFDRELNYDKLVKACYFIQKKVPYICTHPDVVCPTNEDMIPDCGAITALIEKATGIKPLTVLGKPTYEMAKYIEKYTKHKGRQIVLVGDRLYTDMRMANKMGWYSILVLTGETSKKSLRSARKSDIPKRILNSLAGIREIVK
jgi:HAD superfamily hydrolase (TIGR01450 family)